MILDLIPFRSYSRPEILDLIPFFDFRSYSLDLALDVIPVLHLDVFWIFFWNYFVKFSTYKKETDGVVGTIQFVVECSICKVETQPGNFVLLTSFDVLSKIT